MFTKKQAARKLLDFMNAHLPQHAFLDKIYYKIYLLQREPRKAPRTYYPASVDTNTEYPKAGEFF